MTLNEITYSIWEIVRSTISDDDSIDIRQIEFEVHNQRALWLRNEFNKNRTIDSDVIQDLGCVELEIVDSAECCELNSECSMIRTKSEIPQTIERHNNHTITRVGPINKLDKAFKIIPYSSVPYIGNGRFTSNETYAFLHNRRIYLMSKSEKLKYVTHINIQGVFEDPTLAAKFNTCENKPCYTDNSNYPLKRWTVNYISDIIIKKFIQASSALSDNDNDAKEPEVTSS